MTTVALPARVLAVILAAVPMCFGATANEVARLLAGMPVGPTSTLKDVMESPAWKAHAEEFDRVWKSLETERLPAMQRFQNSELNRPEYRQRVLLYPFGGPDALNALTLFPHNSIHILIGLEPIGSLPDENALRKDLDRLLADMRESLGSLFQRSFFITREMDRSLRGQMFNGVLPDILVQLVRMDAEVLGVSPVQVAEGGVLAPWDREKVSARAVRNRGIEIVFRRAGQTAPQRLFFFSVNLGPKLARNRAFLTYLDRTAPFVTFLKATSYMPHQQGFRTICQKLLETSDAILQDDSGIPFSYYQSPEWQVQLYGEYEKPYGSFHYLEQPDLHQAYSAPGAAKKLEFRIGYGFSKVPSNLLLARRKPAASGVRSHSTAPSSPSQ
jgi:hypothetical protein